MLSRICNLEEQKTQSKVKAEARKKEHMVKKPAVSDVCIQYEDVYDGAFHGLFDEDDDAIGESMTQGSVANERVKEPCESLLVGMPLESDSQDVMSEDSSMVTSHES